MIHLESDSRPEMQRAQQRLTFGGGASGVCCCFRIGPVLEFAEVNQGRRVSCALCSRESIGWSRCQSSIRRVYTERLGVCHLD